ncbi:hypothetical protein C8R42DRAFT_640368 [Lentinula raphanica]|nr:hypothetical protein C8R42DRAFT_640368 [Lentinula raphanica]
MAPNFKYHNLPISLEADFANWCVDVEYWAARVSDDKSLAWQGAKYSSSKDKVKFTTSNKTIFLNDVHCSYTHLLIRVSRDAACMNKEYLRAYDNLTEELLSAVNAYCTIRDEIPKQFPKLSEEGGKNAEIVSFYIQLNDLRRKKLREDQGRQGSPAVSTRGPSVPPADPEGPSKSKSKGKEVATDPADPAVSDADAKFMAKVDADLAEHGPSPPKGPRGALANHLRGHGLPMRGHFRSPREQRFDMQESLRMGVSVPRYDPPPRRAELVIDHIIGMDKRIKHAKEKREKGEKGKKTAEATPPPPTRPSTCSKSKKKSPDDEPAALADQDVSMADNVEDSTPAKAKNKTKKRDIVETMTLRSLPRPRASANIPNAMLAPRMVMRLSGLCLLKHIVLCTL